MPLPMKLPVCCKNLMDLFKACFIVASNVNPADLKEPPGEAPAFK